MYRCLRNAHHRFCSERRNERNQRRQCHLRYRSKEVLLVVGHQRYFDVPTWIPTLGFVVLEQQDPVSAAKEE
ncbi:hypothetical protein O9993_16265 [Vibrio lentus]|nr:hypothetical protein [Vibrio lentus]